MRLALRRRDLMFACVTVASGPRRATAFPAKADDVSAAETSVLFVGLIPDFTFLGPRPFKTVVITVRR